MAALKLAKAALRKEMKAKVLPREEIQRQSAHLTQRLLQHPAYKEAETISLYLPMPDEVDTLGILKHALERGKRCYIPRYFVGRGNGRMMEMVLLADYRDYETLPETRWKIKQPPDDQVRPEALNDEHGLDLVLVPGMAFSPKDGRRLGRGKGYYDAYLAKAKGKLGDGRPKTMALAFVHQILPHVPVDHRDFLIDVVIYPES